MKKLIIILLLLCPFLLGAQDYWNTATVKLYPNPATNGYFYLEVADTTMPPLVKIYNMQGRLVMIENIGEGNTIVMINISHLKRGTYIIKLEGYDKRYIKKKDRFYV